MYANSMEGETYIDLPSAQQFVPANGLVILHRHMDLRLTGVDHESALFIPKERGKGLEKMCKDV